MPEILLPYVIFEQRYKGTNFWWIYQIFKRLFSLKFELFFAEVIPVITYSLLTSSFLNFSEMKFLILYYIYII